jgi:DHA2 family multidrug resistance protein
MMTIMTGLPPAKISGAAGLFNFLRMLAASVGTAVGVTFWDERTVVHRERLVESVSRDSAGQVDMFMQLQGPAADPQGAMAMLESMITREASTLAQQDLFLIFGAGMLVMSAGAWWLRVKPGPGAPPGPAAAAHD